MELSAVAINKDRIGIMETLSFVLDEKSAFHSVNKRRQSDQTNNSFFIFTNSSEFQPVVTERSELSGFVKKFDSKDEKLNKILIDFLELFDSFKGFNSAIDRFEEHLNGTRPMNFFTLYCFACPFFVCLNQLSEEFIEKFIRPLYKNISSKLHKLNDLISQNQGENLLLDLNEPEIFERIRKHLLNCSEFIKEERLPDKVLVNLILQSFFDGIRTGSFKVRMKNLHNLNKILLLSNKSSAEKVEFLDNFTPEILTTWISKYIGDLLSEHVHNLEYVEKVKQFLLFLQKHGKFSTQDIDTVWALRTGKHETIVKNINELIIHLAKNFDQDQSDHVLALIKNEWTLSNIKQKHRLISFIKRLVIETKSPQISDFFLNFLWEYSLSREISEEIARVALNAHLSILKSDNASVSDNSCKKKWITLFIQIIEGKLSLNNNNTKSSVYTAFYAIDHFKRLILPDNNSTSSMPKINEILNWLRTDYDLIVILTDNLVKFVSTVTVKEPKLLSNDLCSSASSTLSRDSTSTTNDEVISFTECITQIDTRLQFIQSLVVSKNFEISLATLQRIWKCLMITPSSKNANNPPTSLQLLQTPFELEQFEKICTTSCLNWFQSNLYSKLDLETVIQLNRTTILALCKTKYTMLEFNLFKYIFEFINMRNGNLVEITDYSSLEKPTKQFCYLVNNIELDEIEHLWHLVMECGNEGVCEQATRLLLHLHTNLNLDIVERQTEINRIFIDKCLKNIKDSTKKIESMDSGRKQDAEDVRNELHMIRRSLKVLNNFIIQSETSYDTHSYWEREHLPLHLIWKGSKILVRVSCNSEFEGDENVIRKPSFNVATSLNHTFIDLHRELLEKSLRYLGISSLISRDYEDKDKILSSITLKISFIDNQSKVVPLSQDEYYLPLIYFITMKSFFSQHSDEFIFKIHVELVEKKRTSQDYPIYRKEPPINISRGTRSLRTPKNPVTDWISSTNNCSSEKNPNISSSRSSSSHNYRENSKSSSLNNECEENQIISDLEIDEDEELEDCPFEEMEERGSFPTVSNMNNNPSISSVSVYGQERYLPGFQLSKSSEYTDIVIKSMKMTEQLAISFFDSSNLHSLAVLHQVEDLLLNLVQWTPPFKNEKNSLMNCIQNELVIQHLNEVFQRSSSEFLYTIQILYSILKPKEEKSSCFPLSSPLQEENDQEDNEPSKLISSLISQGIMPWLLNHSLFNIHTSPYELQKSPCFIITRYQMITSWLLRLIDLFLDFYPMHRNQDPLPELESLFTYTIQSVNAEDISLPSRKSLFDKFLFQSYQETNDTDSELAFKFSIKTYSPQYGYNLTCVMPDKCSRELNFDKFLYCFDSDVISEESEPLWHETAYLNKRKLNVLLSYDTAHLPRSPRGQAYRVLPKFMLTMYKRLEEENKIPEILKCLLENSLSSTSQLLRGDIQYAFKECLHVIRSLSTGEELLNFANTTITSTLDTLKAAIKYGKQDSANEFSYCFRETMNKLTQKISNDQLSHGLEDAFILSLNQVTAIISECEIEQWDHCQLINLFNISQSILESKQDLNADLQGFLSMILKKILFTDSYRYYKFNSNDKLLKDFQDSQEPPVSVKEAAFEFLLQVMNRFDDLYQNVGQILSNLHFNNDLRQTYMEWLPNFDQVKSNYVGLKNAGATCYLNSILQQIFAIEPLRYAILNSKPLSMLNRLNEKVNFESDSDQESLEDSAFADESLELSRDKVHNLRVLAQLQRLFVHLKFSQLPFYNPQGFLSEFTLWGEKINKHEQHDALEFFSCLIDNIDEGMILCNKLKPFESLFMGTTENQMICRDCPHRTQRDETFMTINADVHQLNTLKESLEQYVKADLLEGGNAYKCEICQKKVTAVKRAVIKHCPPILAVQLLRFRFDFEQNIAIKSNGYFEFPRQLDLYPYTVQGTASFTVEDEKLNQNDYSSMEELRSNSNSNISNRPNTPSFHDSVMSSSNIQITNNNTKYTLRGIVVHNGQASGGHYYSFIRIQNPTSKEFLWYRFDDRDVKEIDLDNDQVLRSECFGGQVDDVNRYSKASDGSYMSRDKNWNAYILFYERDDIFGSTNFFSDPKRLTDFFKCLKPSNGNKDAQPIPSPITDFNTESSCEVVLSVIRRNLKYAHKKSQLSKPFINFVHKFTKMSANRFSKISERKIREHYSAQLLSQILPFFVRIVMKIDYKYCYKWIPILMQLLNNGTKPCTEFVNSFVMSTSTTLSDYLFDAPQLEVRLTYGILLTHYCKYIHVHSIPLGVDLNSLLESYAQDLNKNFNDNKSYISCNRLVNSLRKIEDSAIKSDEQIYILDILLKCLLHEMNFSNSKCLYRLKNSVSMNSMNYYQNNSIEMTNLFQYGIVNLFENRGKSDGTTQVENENLNELFDHLMCYYQPGCFAQYLALLCDVASISRSVNRILNEKHQLVALLIEFLNEEDHILNMSVSNLNVMSGRLNRCPILPSSAIDNEITQENLTHLIISHLEKNYGSTTFDIPTYLWRFQKETAVTILMGIFGSTALPKEYGLNSSSKIYSTKVKNGSDFNILSCSVGNCTKMNFFILLSHCLCSMDTSRYYSSPTEKLNPFRTYSDDDLDPYDCEISENIANVIFNESNDFITIIIKDYYDSQYFHHIAKISLFLCFENYGLSRQALDVCFMSISNPVYYSTTKLLRDLLFDLLTIDDSLMKKRFEIFLILTRNLNKSFNTFTGSEKQISVYLEFLVDLLKKQKKLAEIIFAKEAYCDEFFRWTDSLENYCNQRIEKIEEILKSATNPQYYTSYNQKNVLVMLQEINENINCLSSLADKHGPRQSPSK